MQYKNYFSLKRKVIIRTTFHFACWRFSVRTEICRKSKGTVGFNDLLWQKPIKVLINGFCTGDDVIEFWLRIKYIKTWPLSGPFNVSTGTWKPTTLSPVTFLYWTTLAYSPLSSGNGEGVTKILRDPLAPRHQGKVWSSFYFSPWFVSCFPNTTRKCWGRQWALSRRRTWSNRCEGL